MEQETDPQFIESRCWIHGVFDVRPKPDSGPFQPQPCPQCSREQQWVTATAVESDGA